MTAQAALPRWPDIAHREPLAGAAAGNSAASLERVVFADGRRFVLKHLPRSGDWLTRATDGAGRTRQLWDTGSWRRSARLSSTPS